MHGRNAIPFEDRVKFDYRYVTSWSLLGDLQLMAKTPPIVLVTNSRFLVKTAGELARRRVG